MGTAPACASVGEALDMVRAGLGYLAAADAAQLPAATQAECLRELERHDAVATAARAGFLAAFTAGQGPAGDGDYSAVSWLIHRTGITRGAAVGHSAWAKRAATHPRVVAALAAGQVSESAGRLICLWTGKLPQEHRDAADEQLLAAFAAGPATTSRPARPAVSRRVAGGARAPGPLASSLARRSSAKRTICSLASVKLLMEPGWAGRRTAAAKLPTCTRSCWPPSRTPPPNANASSGPRPSRRPGRALSSST